MLLEIKNISKEFKTERNLFQSGPQVQAVQNISFSIQESEIIALVGESGSGKSTLGKIIQGLVQPTHGELFFNTTPAHELSRFQRAHQVQTIFQDPFASLNPKLSVGTLINEAIQSSKTKTWSCEKLLQAVGLPLHITDHFPHQFSGGQRQRIVIARCLAMQPKLIIADEPVSALDVSIQAQILNLILDINQKYKTAFLLITHDLSIVQHLADRVIVIQNGNLMEEGTVEQIFSNPKNNYTKKLISAIPMF